MGETLVLPPTPSSFTANPVAAGVMVNIRPGRFTGTNFKITWRGRSGESPAFLTPHLFAYETELTHTHTHTPSGLGARLRERVHEALCAAAVHAVKCDKC